MAYLNLDSVAAQAWRCFPHTYAHKQSRGQYQLSAHIRLISTTVVEMLDAGGGLLVIEAPPRHSKSETASRWLPEWYLASKPDRHVILASYGAELAQANSRIVRNGLRERGGALGVQLAADSTAVNRWHTTAGGSCTGVGVGGALTGFGGHLMIVDDPLKDAEEAESEVMRQKVIDWFQSVLWTRREPGALVIVMATRWHEEDLTGWILAHPELGKLARHIRLPALAESDDVLGRQPGEPLWPWRHNLEALRQARIGMSERWWNALFQQRPTSAEGAEIKRHWWRWYDELPIARELMDLRAMSVDAAFRDSDGSDYVAIGAAGIYGPRRYMLELTRERMGFVDTVKAILTMRELVKPNVILIEAKANGDAIIEQLHREGVSELVGITPKASKLARARAGSPQIEAGNVWLPKTRWAEHMVEEHAAFPLGKNDDTVDMLSQLLNYLGDMRSTPVHELRGGDDSFVSPDIAAERNRDAWRSVFDRVRRAV